MHTDSVAPRLGELAELRRAKGMSLDQIADRTKINPRYLRAIEAGRLDDLPDGIYRRSYLRQYAEMVQGGAR